MAARSSADVFFHVAKRSCAISIARLACSKDADETSPTTSLGFDGFSDGIVFSVKMRSPSMMSGYFFPNPDFTEASAACMAATSAGLVYTLMGSLENGARRSAVVLKSKFLLCEGSSHSTTRGFLEVTTFPLAAGALARGSIQGLTRLHVAFTLRPYAAGSTVRGGRYGITRRSFRDSRKRSGECGALLQRRVRMADRQVGRTARVLARHDRRRAARDRRRYRAANEHLRASREYRQRRRYRSCRGAHRRTRRNAGGRAIHDSRHRRHVVRARSGRQYLRDAAAGRGRRDLVSGRPRYVNRSKSGPSSTRILIV